MEQRTANFTIQGRIPSKKNSRVLSYVNGRIRSFPNKQYTQWHKRVIWTLPNIRFERVDLITVDFWMPDKRRTDLTNKVESIMDLLVDAGMIPDDNCEIVRSLLLRYQGIDRENPHVDIKLEGTD